MVKKILEFDSKAFPFLHPLTPIKKYIDRRGLISRFIHVLTSECYSFICFQRSQSQASQIYRTFDFQTAQFQIYPNYPTRFKKPFFCSQRPAQVLYNLLQCCLNWANTEPLQGPRLFFFYTLLGVLFCGGALSHTFCFAYCPFTSFCIVLLLPPGLCNSLVGDCPLLSSSSGSYFLALFRPTDFFWQLQLEVPIFFCELVQYTPVLPFHSSWMFSVLPEGGSALAS